MSRDHGASGSGDHAERPLVLASQSPRRAGLLLEAGWAFTQDPPGFDDGEMELPPLPPVRIAEALAYLKAADVATRHEDELVIGCDTVLDFQNQCLGKPRDREDARQMLGKLFDEHHRVISAVAMIDGQVGRCELLHDVADVVIAHPGHTAFEQYLQSDQWQGKAGGYNLAELQQAWRFTIQGDPTTVIGLPMHRLGKALRAQ